MFVLKFEGSVKSKIWKWKKKIMEIERNLEKNLETEEKIGKEREKRKKKEL